MDRADIINTFIRARGYRAYLEIGVSCGDSFRRVVCERKVGVDPDSCSAATVFKTSDEFFASNRDKFDVVFVDGLRKCEQVLRDIENALASLNPGGVVVVRGCLPQSESMASREDSGGVWCGDAYKAVAWFFSSATCLCYTVDTDYGVGVIDTAFRAAPSGFFPCTDMRALVYSEFSPLRQSLMRVVQSRDLGVMMSGPSVCVVVPVYKSEMSASEQDSLRACFSVLAPRHDVVFVCGDGFDASAIPEEYHSVSRFERFPDKYFSSVQDYSALMASPDFYSRFMAYTHILVYQLDGYVFRDDLMDRWVVYDYVGAPWCFLCGACASADIPGRVGNGGVSLRNVRRCLDVVRYFNGEAHSEDWVVFATSNPRAAVFSRPGCHEALEFSMETGSHISGYGFTRKVPSFCHALERYDAAMFDTLKRAATRDTANAGDVPRV